MYAKEKKNEIVRSYIFHTVHIINQNKVVKKLSSLEHCRKPLFIGDHHCRVFSDPHFGSQWKVLGSSMHCCGVSDENLEVSNENLQGLPWNLGSPMKKSRSPIKFCWSPMRLLHCGLRQYSNDGDFFPDCCMWIACNKEQSF